jgi:hypothetical protein
VHRGNNGLQCKNLEQIHSRQRSLKRFGANAVLAIDLVDSDTPRGNYEPQGRVLLFGYRHAWG